MIFSHKSKTENSIIFSVFDIYDRNLAKLRQMCTENARNIWVLIFSGGTRVLIIILARKFCYVAWTSVTHICDPYYSSCSLSSRVIFHLNLHRSPEVWHFIQDRNFLDRSIMIGNWINTRLATKVAHLHTHARTHHVLGSNSLSQNVGWEGYEFSSTAHAVLTWR